jgi:signal transduction histidine kinase
VARDVVARALRAAGAVSCRLDAADFTFTFLEPSAQEVTGIGAGTWCESDFWDRYLHPEDRAALDEARASARSGNGDVSFSFRLLSGATSLAMRLFAQRLPRAPRSKRPALGGYLIRYATNDAAAAGTPPLASGQSEMLDQARQDLIRTAQLAVAGELVGAITHDLRQPITALQVNVDVALELLRRPTPDIAGAMGALEDASTDGLVLRDSVQVLADLVARRKPRIAAVALGAVVGEVVKLVHSEALARHVIVDVGNVALLPKISADSTMLREAVLSLLLDAVENADPDARGARVSVSAVSADRSRVELTVSHRRRPGATVDDAWALTVARSVAEAHAATMLVDVNPTSEVMVRTTWPTRREDVSYQD